MERVSALVCVGLMCAASAVAAMIDPRGARPVEPQTRAESCAGPKTWPFCSDDDWGSKCPSGCRIQGLMDKYDNDLLKKIEKVRSLLDQNQVKHRAADQVSKQTYTLLRDKLTVDAGHDNDYYDLAQNLRGRITDMKIKIDRQLQILAALKERVRDQVAEMQKLEVDIDIKLRSCKGSCKSYSEYQVDQGSYESLDKQMTQLDAQAAQSVESVGTLYVMKSKPLKDVHVDSIYKSKDVDGPAGQQKEDMFPGVNKVQFVLEAEGSKTSPATISKVPGTSLSSSSSSSSSTSSSSSSPSKSITELSGHGDGIFSGPGVDFDAFSSSGTTSTKGVTCIKTVRKTIVHSKDGPEERLEEVVEGGPECQRTAELNTKGLSSLFPSITETSSSSTKNFHVGDAKGSLFSSKAGFPDPFGDTKGMDLGAFLTDAAEDDVPDFHARSVKTAHVVRRADYVGKDCVDVFHNHLSGETSGVFKIRPGGAAEVDVYCQQEALMGGWLLVQQRESGVLNFNRSWAEYGRGFGSVDARGRGELWIGNQRLHLLTGQGESVLRVELEDREGGRASADYIIRVGAEEDGYPLHVSGYTGDAGDALGSHSGMKFSTADKDNDQWEQSCAATHGGGWWYHRCQSANLNGIYPDDVLWATGKPPTAGLKTVRMFVRPAAL